MDSSEFSAQVLAFLTAESWMIQVFVVIFAALLADWLQKRLHVRLQKQLAQTSNYWDDALFDAARRPLSALIWIIGLTFAAEIVRQQSEAFIFEAIAPIRNVGVVICITWFLIRFISRAEANIISQGRVKDPTFDRTTADAIAKLLRVSVMLTAALVILQTLGYSISGVLAFGGIGGLAVGFAAKDLLANFFGGLMIYMDRPFEVGNWVRSPDKEIEGVVESIGWRLTCIRTFDKRPLYVPNSIFNTISLENPSRMTNRRIYETIGIRYQDVDKMDAIVADVKAMLQTHGEIDTGQTMIVNFNRFAPSSLDFFVYAFTRTREWVRYHEIKHDIMLKIIAIIEQHGAEVAFPTSTIHLIQEPETAGLPDPGQSSASAIS